MKNKIGRAISNIGCIAIIIGVVVGIITWISVSSLSKSVLLGFVSGLGACSAFVFAGIMLLGFSEIIILLQENLNEQRKIKADNTGKTFTVKVINNFNDIETGIFRQAGEIIQVSERRYHEIAAAGPYIEFMSVNE